MITLLICNIGNRDVQVAAEHLPESVREGLAGIRMAYILEHQHELRPHMELAIIRKVLAMAASMAVSVDTIVLFGSQQDDPAYSHTDTYRIAELVQDLICEQTAMERSQVLVKAIQANPADQNSMLHFYERMLPQIDAMVCPKRVFIEVTGGTAAMSNGLQLAGIEVFEERAEALYVFPKSELPQRLNIGRRLLGGPLRKVLQANLAGYQYAAAQATWRLFEPYFTDTAPRGVARVVEALLGHAAARINLDLGAARTKLMDASAAADGRYQSRISAFYNSITPQDFAVGLAEVLHVAQTRLETLNYADFLTQLVRFVENGLRSVCLSLGVQFVNFQGQPDQYGAKVAQSWLDQHGIAGKIPIGQAGLQQLLRKFAPNDAQARAMLELAQTLEPLIRLRNATTHSLAGISEADLEQAAGRRAAEMLALLDATFATLVGSARPANPYHTINHLVAELLKESR